MPATVFISTAAPKTGTSTFCPSCYADCRKSAKADTGGNFNIESLDPQLTFQILAVAKGYKPKFVSKVDPAKGPVKIELEPIESSDATPDRSLRGRVLDAKGEPLESAVVEMEGVRTVWITSLAFIAANLGAQEVIGMCASGAKYGIMTAHFYWIGAVPAMLFVGIFMMPFYYGSKARSVPEYLKLRFDEKTRGLNAITFAVMTIFSSGISMYALGLMFQLVLGWSFTSSVLLSAFIVLGYTLLGGLTSAIYNEVLQFFLIVLGFAPLAILATYRAGG